MGNKIDDIFKEGLEGKGLPYSDAHWQQMESILPAKAAFNWWKAGAIGSGAVAVVAISLFLFYTPKSDNIVVSERDTEQSVISDNDFSESKNDESTSELLSQQYIGSNSDQMTTDNTTILTNSNSRSSVEMSNERDAKAQKRDIVKYKSVTSELTEGSIPNFSEISDKTKLEEPIVPAVRDQNNSMEKFSHEDVLSSLANVERQISLFKTTTLLKSDEHANSSVTLLKSPYPKRWSLYVSPFIEYANYTYNRDLSFPYRDEIGNLENSNAISSVNYGVNLRAQRGKWSLSTGLLLNRLQEKTNFNKINTYYEYEKALKLVEPDYSSTSGGTRVALLQEVIVDSTQVSEESTPCEDCLNDISYVSIPLSLRYNFNKARLTYFGEIGGLISFARSSKGDFAIANPETGLVEVRSVNATNDLNAVLTSITATVGVDYRISTRISAWSSVGVRNGITSMYQNSNHVIRNTSLNLGVSYRIK